MKFIDFFCTHSPIADISSYSCGVKNRIPSHQIIVSFKQKSDGNHQAPDPSKDVDVEEDKEEDREKASAEEPGPVDVIPDGRVSYLLHVFHGF